MNVSFQEKSTWIRLIGVLLVFGVYFQQLLTRDVDRRESLVLFIGSVVALVIIQVTLHVLVTLTNVREAQRGGDERDHLIDLRATRFSSAVLSTGVVLVASLWLFDATPFAMANGLLLSLVLSQVVQHVTQIVLYRRGI